MRYYRPTFAEINLKNLGYNFRQIRKLVAPGTRIMVTIKADAYGHGLIPVAQKLVECGVDCFGVASIDEGVLLREAGITIPILILGAVLKTDVEPIFDYDLTATVCEPQVARALDARASGTGKPVSVHVKIDTGMGRIGVLHQEAGVFVRKLNALKNVRLEGIFTHFAFADMDKDFTQYQIGLFNKLLDELKRSGISIPLVHAANSMGVIEHGRSHFNMVRPGIVIYGLHPKDNIDIKLKPVLSLKTKVVFVKKVPSGCGVSYGHEYVTGKPTRIATMPIGYGDGYPRNLSNQAPVLIRGKRFTVCGRICMDQMMVDIGDFSVKVGDTAVLIGSQGKETITVEELASLSGTIPYEIVCGLGSRIPRIYVE